MSSLYLSYVNGEYIGTGEDAVKLALSDEDSQKFDDLPRGHGRASVAVKNLQDGQLWSVRRASCGLKCYCAAAGIKIN